MIYIDKCRTDLGVTVDEWAVDDRCRFSDSGKVGIGTGVRVLDVTDKFGDVLVRLVISDSCSDNVSRFSCRRCCLMNKELLEPIMRAHGDKNKDLAAAIGMSVPNFSTIWNGRGEFALKYIRLIARRYSLTPEQVYKIFIFPQG